MAKSRLLSSRPMTVPLMTCSICWAAVRERDNTIARVHAVFAEMDAHAPVTSNGFFYALKLRAALYPAAFDPQETP